ncbi:MAG TPA: DUF1906 domain-containing protein [Solirubrobacterales bacterium]
MRLLRPAIVAIALLAIAVPTAHGEAKTIHFRGKTVRVPASSPVYRLAQQPGMCVRLDRRAVYLGTPRAGQRCPARAVGRRRAILIDPAGETRAARATSSIAPLLPVSGPATFTGLGFDACSAPSSRAMRAWADSPYRAVGIYIGGLNRGCSQPNLNSSWIAEQVSAGWHLIPTYVGLQAPTSSCTSCATLSSRAAATQGTDAADDAATDAREVGIGPGSPIYFDMESYTRTAGASSATLTFLAAWTARLHILGYASGVYSSSASGIADLVSRIGTGYTLPDDIWIANWNGRQSTVDPFVPASAWSLQQRLHQYRGGHNETYGGVTINIDNDYLDGATAGPPVALGDSGPPPLTVDHVKAHGSTVRVWVRCGWATSTSCPGQIIVRTHLRVKSPTQGRSAKPRTVRIALARRSFSLGGGQGHVFRVRLSSRGRLLLHLHKRLESQLLVAIPESRHTQAMVLSRLPRTR